MALLQRTFTREIEIESENITLKIHQCEVGDVGCVVWDSGLVLAKYLEYKHCFLKGHWKNKYVIELGAGTGLVGLTAACLGASVLLTDLPALLPLLELNLTENGDKLQGNTEARILKWGQDVSAFVKPDIILVADCIYYQQLSITRKNKNCPSSQSQLIEDDFLLEELQGRELHPDYTSPDIHVIRLRKK
ncbi:protein-lysine methyltransferase METTL21D-like [Limulus polyphemus]|uniref:Protein-lysine methyltransferase METTL21D-like n=1 Tax=Limulus polyphemus TaxID=6850 RepID=A0ABM1T7F2_LIMPO|nr:protein-lysine methyltransferase METTL21D-like [Limulus polyphemus]